jgi:hypothetical protein
VDWSRYHTASASARIMNIEPLLVRQLQNPFFHTCLSCDAEGGEGRSFHFTNYERTAIGSTTITLCVTAKRRSFYNEHPPPLSVSTSTRRAQIILLPTVTYAIHAKPACLGKGITQQQLYPTRTRGTDSIPRHRSPVTSVSRYFVICRSLLPFFFSVRRKRKRKG